MEKWLDKGPELSELVSERLDRRSSRKDVAVVITTSGNPEVLEEHLGALGKQKFRDFDVLIVYGQRDSFAAGPRWAGILHLREKARGGSSGAFYIGQKAALEEGYRTIILADDDCIPVSDDLMGRLAQGVEEGHKILLPKLDKGERGIRMTRIPHYYGAFGREVFERAGLTYLPLFFGGDDVELFHRMAK